MSLLWASGCGEDEEAQPPAGNNGGQCSAETPVCDAACGAGQVCAFNADSSTCGCIDFCDSNNPVCEGGCGANQFCAVGCVCTDIVCQADAPVCNPGCGVGQVCNATCACEAAPEPPPANLLPRPSRSTAVDISPNDAVVAMVNTDDGSVSFFNATPGQEGRVAKVASSAQGKSEPMSVIIHPDGKRAFVANRATGTVRVINGIDTTTPTPGQEAQVGSEPVGLALTPTGATLYVTDWVGGEVVALNTNDLSVTARIKTPGNPFALAITNDGDNEDSDEKVLVTRFFAAARGAEATDDGRRGEVYVIDVGATALNRTIELAPLAQCFTGAIADQMVTSGCFPNQLYGIAIHTAFNKTRAYVISVAASPAGPVNFNHNMQSLVSVIDVNALAEEPALARNLNALIAGQADSDGDENQGRRFLNVPVGIDFVPNPDVAIGYVASSASDMVLRLQYDDAGGLVVGSPMAFNIPVGQSPQGLVIRHNLTGSGAYVANLVTRDLSVVSFRDQRQEKTIPSSDQPAMGSPEFNILRGKRFFNTSTGIWSREGWGSCQACHPLGLTDNITWSFAAGPRQSVSLDGQYASNDPSDMRALNWTAVFDETHDFELNTRGVSGGRGTFQNANGPIGMGGTPFAMVTAEDGATVENHQALNGSARFLAETGGICTNTMTCPDFGFVDDYIRTIRSPRAVAADAAQLERGRAVFQDAGCDKCHAGPKWTVSRTFFTPEDPAGDLPDRLFPVNMAFETAMDPTALRTLPMGTNVDTTLVAGDDSNGGAPALKRIACNLRVVGTFGAQGGAAEVRANNTPAQGMRGFNPPSLLGLSTGAPYLHNGAVANLRDLFAANFDAHTKAGNPNFAPNAANLDDLVAFLLSIDESTAPFPILPETVLCPTDF